MATTYAPPGVGGNRVRQRRFAPLPANGGRPQTALGIGAPQIAPTPAGVREPGGNTPTVSYASGSTRPMSQSAQQRVAAFNAMGGANQAGANMAGSGGNSASAQARLAAFNNIGGAFSPEAYQRNQQQTQARSSGIPEGWVKGPMGDWSPGPGSQGIGGGGQQPIRDAGGRPIQGAGGRSPQSGNSRVPSWYDPSQDFGTNNSPEYRAAREAYRNATNPDGVIYNFAGGGQQGGIFGNVQRQAQNPANQSPEQRWAQSQGALPWTRNMTGDENKANLANQLFNQFNLRTGQPGGGQNFYEGVGQFARQGIGGVQPYGGQQSPYASQAADMFGQFSGQRAPQPGAAPFQYDRVNAPGYNQPQYDQASGVGFDPASAGSGPQLSGISDIDQNFQRFNASGIGGPQSRNISGANQGAFNQFSQDYGDGTIGGTIAREGNRVGRESIQGSDFENNAGYRQFNNLAGQGLQSGLASAQSLATGGGFGIDAAALDAAAKRQYELAAQAGADKAIGRGFSPSGGSIGGREIGRAISDKAGELAIQRQQMLLQAEGQRQQGRIAGVGALQGIGSTAGGLAGDRGRMLQDDSRFLGESALQQRQQDIGQRGQEIDQRSQDITQRGQTLGAQNDIASQRRADFQANTDRGAEMSRLQQQADEAMQRGDQNAYAEATRRMSALGDINNQENSQSNQLQQLRLQAEQARQDGDIAGYNALTNRINTMSQSSIGQYNAETGRYEANTGRGRVNADAMQAAQQLGYNYEQLNQQFAQMGANNLQSFNDQMLNAFSGDTDRLQVLTNGMTNLAQLDQNGMIEAGRQAMEYGGLMAQLLRDGSNATQAADELSLRAQQGDRDAFIELYTFLAGMGSQRQMNRENNRFNPGQAITNLAGGAISGGLFGGGGGGSSSGSGGYSGMSRQRLSYGGG